MIIRRVAWVMVLALIFLGGTLSAAQELNAEEKAQYEKATRTVTALYGKAEIYYKKGTKDDLQKALDALKEIIAVKFPEKAKGMEGYLEIVRAYGFMGVIYMDMNKLKEAEDAVLKGLELAPTVSELTSDLYLTLAAIYKQQGKEDKALDAFDKADSVNQQLKKKEDKKSSNK